MAVQQESAAPTPRSLLHNRGFMALITGQFVSRAGDALFSLASVWLVLDLTNNNPLASSAALAVEFLPYLLFGLVAGAYVDRWDRRRIMIAADTLRGVVTLAVPLLAALDALRVWHVFAVSFLLSSFGRLFQPARQAVIPDLVDASQLVRANAIIEGTGQAAWIAGPALGGVLVALVGAANVYCLDAASFFVSAATLLLVRPRPHPRARAGGSLRQELLDAVRYVRERAILRTTLLVGIVGLVAFAPVPALLPVLVRGAFGAGSRELGALMACFFAGSVLTSVGIARVGEHLHRGWALAGSLGTVGIGTLVLALAPSLTLAGLMLLVLGGGAALFNVAEYSIFQAETVPELRGRVTALANVTSQAVRPPILIGAGAIAGLADARAALALLAGAALLAALGGVTSHALRAA
jgi:MFS family permease